jgi:hypothetical protein
MTPRLYVVKDTDTRGTKRRPPQWPPSGIKEHGETIRRLVDYLTDCDRHDTEDVLHAAVDIVNAAAAVEVLIAGHAREAAPVDRPF